MGFKFISLQIIVRIILLLLTICGITYLLMFERFMNMLASLFLLFALLGVQIFGLYWWLTKTGRQISRLFDSIRSGDAMLRIPDSNLPKGMDELFKSMNEAIMTFGQIRKEQDAQLQFFQIMMNNVQTGILCWDENHTIRFQNPCAAILLNLDYPLIWNNLVMRYPEIVERTSVNSKFEQFSFELSTSLQKKILLVIARSFKLLNREYRLVTIEDIAPEILRKENEVKQNLLRVLSHEIRNSVTPMISISKTLEMIWRDEEGNRKMRKDFSDDDLSNSWLGIQTVKERGQKLMGFIDEALKVTSLPQPKKVRIIVLEMLLKMKDLMGKESNAIGVDIQIDCPDQALAMEADPVLIEQVLINLISNSLYALRESSQPKIRISVFPTDYYLHLHVNDNGVGIPEKQIEQVFLPFFTTKKDGIGLGLSICCQLIGLHGGTIFAKSDPYSGTTFTISLPMSPETKLF